MPGKIVTASDFKADCLKLIDAMQSDGEALTVTRRGCPVALVTPITEQKNVPFVGAMEGSVLRFDEPFEPAIEAWEWTGAR